MNSHKSAPAVNTTPSFLSIATFLLISVICGATSGPFIRILYNDGLDAAWITCIRLITVSLILWPVMLSNRNRRKDLFSVKKTDIIKIMVSAVFVSGHFFFWTLSLKSNTIFGSSSITSVQYLFTVLIEFLVLMEKPGRGVVVAVILTFAGIAIIGWSNFEFNGDMSGSVYAVISAIFGALYFVMGRQIRKTVSVNAYFTWFNTFGAVLLFIFALAIREPFKPLSVSNVGVFFAIAVLCSIGGHYGINWSLKYVTADVPSLFAFLGPFFAAVFAYIFFGETVSTEVFIGALLILTGIAFYMLMQQKDKKKL